MPDISRVSELSPEDQAMYEEALITPPSSIDLIRGPRECYLRRLMSHERNVAEIFHENSKLCSTSIRSVPLDEDKLAATRKWYFETGYQARPSDFNAEEVHRLGIHVQASDLPEVLSILMTEIAESPRFSSLLFGLDLWVLLDRALYRVPPLSSTLWLEQRFDDESLSRLTKAVPPLAPLQRPDAVFFLGLAPWRYMALQGVRGYRRCLMDAGSFTQQLSERSIGLGADIQEIYDFYDVRLDNLLMLDGVERSIVVVMTLSGTNL